MDQVKIGKFIQEQRKKKKMTQDALAQKLGVSNKSISRWENGKTMPDYTIVKALCDELDITINELLGGEKISLKLYPKKSDENLYNTIDYVQKKVKGVKRIFKYVFLSLILFLVSLIIMFLVDLNKMRNGENTVFSTWGFNYYPNIDLTKEHIEIAIKEYFAKNMDETKYNDTLVTFVEPELFLIDDNDETVKVYAWILIEQYSKVGNVIKNESGSSMPYKIDLVKNGSSYEVKSFIFPKDGEYSYHDLKKIFPKSVIRKIDNAYRNGTVKRLEFKIQNDVKLYFHD